MTDNQFKWLLRGCLVLGFTLLAFSASATKKPPMMMSTTPTMTQKQWSESVSSATSESFSESISEASSIAESISSSDATGGNATGGNVTTNYQRSAPTVVNIPNNNTEQCLRIFGISFANTSGGGGIGWPWRSKACDYEQAADDAAATGDHSLAWYWRCHKRNLYKPFKRKGMTNYDATNACHNKMVGSLIQTEVITGLNEKVLLLEERNREIMAEHALIVDECEAANDRNDERLARCERSLMEQDK